MAAKRYRENEHRTFHRNAGYTEGRKIRDSREARAVAKGSKFGRSRWPRSSGRRPSGSRSRPAG